ncbi:MAG: FAD-dependent oxidoreductase [Candidatus Omnitrophota bacterium]
MNLFEAKLIERIKRTDSIESFRFLPDKKIEFLPGQFLQVIFDEDKLDKKDLNKYLSFSSSPFKNYIEFTKRLSNSIFSQKLNSLEANDTILIKAPLGNCIFKDEYGKIAFLIGGIGITPVISIIEYIMEKKLDMDILLFYSNRTEDEIAFRKELDSWQSQNKKIKIIYTVTDCQPKDKRCLLGHIDKTLLSSKISDMRERVFFTFGPPGMVKAMENLCLELSCNKENIKTESFLGY